MDFVTERSHHYAPATQKFSNKSHHHCKQKIARVAAFLRGDYSWIPFSPNVLAFFLNYLQEISLNPKMLS